MMHRNVHPGMCIGEPSLHPQPTRQEELAAAVEQFTAALWVRLSDERGNRIVSPLSLWLALAMVHAGAGTETARELATVLGMPPEGPEPARLRKFVDQRPDRENVFHVANRLFGDARYPIALEFVRYTTRVFGACLESLDFRADAPAAVGRMNAWVSEQTAGRIPRLMGQLPPDAAMVILSAVYFCGRWAQPFEPRRTVPERFWVSNVDQVTVPTMHTLETLGYGETADAQILELPYAGRRVALRIVLPWERAGLSALEEQVSLPLLRTLSGVLTECAVAVALPRFELNPAPMEMRQVLAAMGVRDMFDRERADLGRMTTSVHPADRLFASAVAHQGFIRVDERGTEAAAATEVDVPTFCAPRPRPKPRSFVADHPFLFLLRDTTRDVTVFAGRVENPLSPRHLRS
jgi:serpin B